MASSRWTTENKLSGIFKGSLSDNVVRTFPFLVFLNVVFFPHSPPSVLGPLRIYYGFWFCVCVCMFKIPECINEWVSVFLVPSLGLFCFCLFCPTPLCLFLFISFHFYSLGTCLLSNERRKGDGSRWEGR